MYHTLTEQLREQYMTSDKWYSRHWHYTEACILKAYLDSYKQSGDRRYYDFVKTYIDSLFDENGTIPQIDYTYYNSDQIKMGSILLDLHLIENNDKYKRIIDSLYAQLQSYPRTSSGSFWHKVNYPDQIWLDGLYMVQPFYVQYKKLYVKDHDYSDTFQQFNNVHEYLYSQADQLYYHAYDESRNIFWCDPVTGKSPCVWGRAVGWFAMALVDVMDLLQSESVDLAPLQSMFQIMIDGMIPYQHESGMWFQVVNRMGQTGNYLESSGTLMMSYSILKAVRLGLLPSTYQTYGIQALNGTTNMYLRDRNGEVELDGICKSAGLGTNPETGVVRDGSFEYYVYREEIAINNGHGVAPLFMAYNESLLTAQSKEATR